MASMTNDSCFLIPVCALRFMQMCSDAKAAAAAAAGVGRNCIGFWANVTQKQSFSSFN